MLPQKTSPSTNGSSEYIESQLFSLMYRLENPASWLWDDGLRVLTPKKSAKLYHTRLGWIVWYA